MQLKQFAFYQKKVHICANFCCRLKSGRIIGKRGEGENTDLELDLQKKGKCFPASLLTRSKLFVCASSCLADKLTN